MILKTLSIAVLTTLVSAVAYAQASAYPTRPIRLIVPFAPGGAADQTARLISEPMAKQLGQPLIVENKPGGGATIGAALVASAAPDGYTVLYTTPGPQIINPYLMAKPPYDPDKDLMLCSCGAGVSAPAKPKTCRHPYSDLGFCIDCGVKL